MRNSLLALVLLLAGVVGTAGVRDVAAQGVPPELAILNARIATSEPMLSSINDKLDNLESSVPTELVTGRLQQAG